MLLPPLLGPGARVALVAPAGPVGSEAEVERALANTRALGWEPALGAHVRERRGYLAGDDAARLADLNAALGDPTIDAIWCIRGGYGTMRLLDGVNYDALRRRPKPIMGFSDVTALLAATMRRSGVVGFHAPTARGELTTFTRHSLERALIQGSDPCGAWPAARTIRPGRAAGRLAGGNLAMLAALVGTPFAPDLHGSVLVLEDVNEPVYRIDRMLRQLRLAGALAGCRALVAGAFTEGGETPAAGDISLDDVLAETADALRVPCLADVPVGHIADQWTIPLGVDAEIDSEARTVFVRRPAGA